jgi:alpha-D-xyloside xylohydrolase
MSSLLLWLSGLACHPATTPPPADPCRDSCLAFVGDTLTLTHGGRTLLTFPADGLAIGTVTAYDPTRAYDPTVLEPGLVAHTLTDVGDTTPTADGTSTRLTWTGGLRGTLTITPKGDGRYALHLAVDPGVLLASVTLSPVIDPTERIYGLGEFFDSADHRGRVRALQIALDLELESLYNEAHVPVPLAIGTTGWGIFVADRHPMVVDAAATRADRLVWTTGLGPDGPDGLTVYLYAADHPLDITARYHADTVPPVLPDRWAYGPLIWRDENVDQAEFEADLAACRDLDLAASGTWIDRPYATGVNTFDFDPTRYPDPDAMIARAHDLGFRVALWHTPYVSPDESPALHAEAEAAGYFPPQTGIAFNGWGLPIDFSNPDASAWWTGLAQRYADRGIEGFKLDYGEDIVVSLQGMVTPWGFDDGTDARTMHKRYAALYHAAYAATLPPTGGFLLCRAGTWGSQDVTRVIWPGDLDADLSAHREPRVDADGAPYVAVGGLPAAIQAALSLGPSGFPLFGSDTGGYRHSPPSAETFLRWAQHTALSTVMQVGNSDSQQPWELLNAEQLSIYRDYARLHLRLFPYVWTLAEQAARGGRPPLRAVGLQYPDIADAPPETYLLGDDLLVAPVITEGATTRTVRFPPGRWIDWHTGEILPGDQSVEVAAPLDTLPLYLAEGGIVPMLRPTIDTLAPATVAGIASAADDPGALWVRVFPGPDRAWTGHDGTAISQSQVAGNVTLAWSDGAEYRGAIFEIVGGTAPTTVTVDGAAWPDGDPESGAAWSWDGAVTRVGVPAGSHTVVVAGG